MKTVWKYNLNLGEENISMPQLARVLSFGSQHGTLCMWAEVETTNPYVPRTFLVVDTGHEVPKAARHLGTTQVAPFVWHLYETTTLSN